MIDDRSDPTQAAMLRVAVVQMASGTDIGHNVEQALDGVRRAAVQGARLVALPEVFTYRGSPDLPRIARTSGTSVEALRSAASDLGIWILAGSLLEAGDAGKQRNVSHLIDPEGAITATYSKVHLFRIDLADVQEDETRYVEFGSDLVLGEIDGIKAGLTICFDVRFPELYRSLSIAGAQIIFVPANFSARTGRDHWTTLLRARAIENQVFIVAPAQAGVGGDGFVAYGHSLVIDPWGRILAEGGDAPDLLLADLDLSLIREVRRDVPVWTSRRPELYEHWRVTNTTEG